MDEYPNRELFKKRVPIFRAQIGKEYTFLLPGKHTLNPKYMFIATLLEYDVEQMTLLRDPFMRLKVRLAPEFQEAWGLDDPVLEWESIRSSLPIYEVPESKARRDFAKKLALLNSKAKLPIEMLGEIMKFQDPSFKGGPHPGKERQAEYWKKEHARQSDEALAAMKAGTRRRRSKQKKTRRRN